MEFKKYKNLKTEYFVLKKGRNEIQICIPILNKKADYSKPQVFTVITGEYTKSYDAISLEDAKRVAELMFNAL